MNKHDCLQGKMSDCVNTLVEEHGICESYWMDGNLTYLDSGPDLSESSGLVGLEKISKKFQKI